MVVSIGQWIFLNYCCENLDVATFQWVFSTLAQVFGALLGLYLFAVFYTVDKLTDAEIKWMKIHQEFLKIFKDVKTTADKLKKFLKIDLDKAKKKFDRLKEKMDRMATDFDQLEDIMKSQTANLDQLTEGMEARTKAFWKLSLWNISSLLSVIIYSIIILSLPNALIDTNFEDYILFYLGILFPSWVMISLIIAFDRVKDTIDSYKKNYRTRTSRRSIRKSKRRIKNSKRNNRKRKLEND